MEETAALNDILIAIIDGLKGFPEAIDSVFPETPDSDLYRAFDPKFSGFLLLEGPKTGGQGAQNHLPCRRRRGRRRGAESFDEGPWGQRFAAITGLCAAIGACHSLFAYPQEVRKMIYTTNSIESLNAKLRRSVRIRGHFPNDEAAMKLIWLQFARSPKSGRCLLANGAPPKRSSFLSSNIARTRSPGSRTVLAVCGRRVFSTR